MIWHSSTIEEIKEELEFDEKQGLTGAQVALRVNKYGENRTVVKEQRNFLKEFAKRLMKTEEILISLLAVVLMITGAIGQKPLWYSSVVILFLIAAGAAAEAFAAIRNDKQISEINGKISVSAKVLREGKTVMVDAALLVPGDIVLIEAGDYIPADGRLLEENSLICDESALTGDSSPNEKNTDAHPEDICPLSNRHNMVYCGCSVTYGRGVMVVTDTGRNTELGKMHKISELNGENETGLKSRLYEIGKIASRVIMIFSAAVFILGVIFTKTAATEGFSDLVFGSLVLALSVYSVSFSTLLPGTVKSAMSFALKSMLGRNAIVKDFSTIEKLGCTSVIISDKTGTLTRNRMKMTSVWSGNEIIDLSCDAPDENSVTLIRTGALCCNGKIAIGASGKEKHYGDPTEIGIVAACRDYCGLSKDELENIYPRMADVPFDSKRKLMTTVNMINNKPFAVVKGAPDILFSYCTGGNLKSAMEAADIMGKAGQRVIGVAIKPLNEVPANPNPENLECDLNLLGLFGMSDYISHSTREALMQCEEAGIRVVMVTGDHITTASAIAKELGILKSGEKAITGEELSAMTDEEFMAEIKNISVYCRVSDSDKIRIVKSWQSLGETVSLTGDSVEDAVVLKEADIGCAMGITGTDISKGSSDIVLSDDSFISVVNAVKIGRSTFYNIRHCIQLFFASIIGELIALLVGFVAFKTPVISSAGILCVNLILLLVLSLALVSEPDRINTMKMLPRKAKEGIFGSLADFDFIWQGVLLGIITLVCYGIFKVPVASFIALGLGIVFLTLAVKNCKDFYHEGIRIKRNMLIGIGLSLAVLLFITLTPISILFSLENASGSMLGIGFVFAFAILVICEAVKFIRFFTKK